MTDNNQRGGDHESHEQGVQTTKEKHGDDFYQKIGHKGGEARKEEGTDYHELGKKGGEARKEQGADYSAMGKKGGQAAHPNGRGLQNADEQTKEEVAQKGGQA